MFWATCFKRLENGGTFFTFHPSHLRGHIDHGRRGGRQGRLGQGPPHSVGQYPYEWAIIIHKHPQTNPGHPFITNQPSWIIQGVVNVPMFHITQLKRGLISNRYLFWWCETNHQKETFTNPWQMGKELWKNGNLTYLTMKNGIQPEKIEIWTNRHGGSINKDLDSTDSKTRPNWKSTRTRQLNQEKWGDHPQKKKGSDWPKW